MKPNDVIKKMKELGCNSDVEIKKIEQIDGAMEVTFMDDGANEKRKLPKSWEEFCEMFPIKDGESYIHSTGEIEEYLYHRNIPRYIKDKNILPDRATSEAVLALFQLIHLRNCYNGDWVPDWTDDEEEKYTIEFRRATTMVDRHEIYSTSPLYFKSKELRDEFLRYFRQLIEKLKPLYGIKGGGEE